ncbi:MAG: nucleotidyltransferase family protein [Anaerolineales bacterium]|nr:MAG: nucleotidyltransferase family protein [Anaerolineales bacterium]
MDAIVIAGGIPRPEDPLYSYVKGDAKALVDIAGKPMVQWVLDALSDAKRVDNVILVGLSPKNQLTCKKPLHFLSNQGRILANIVAGVHKSLELNKKNKYVLIVSSDIPALQAHMVDWLVDTSMQTQDDLYYGVCTREVMEKRFPDSRRTYTPLKDMELCGSDINLCHVRMATEHLDLWESLLGARKSPFKQASKLGLGLLFSLATRQLTLEVAVKRISERIGIKGRAIVWPYAEPCMDVDKPHQLEMMRADLTKQRRRSQPKPKTSAKKTTGKTVKKPSAVKKAVRAKSKSRSRSR